MVDIVDYSKVKKDIKNFPRLVFDKFLKWVKDIEDTDIGWSEVIKLSTYRDHLLKGHRKGQRVACLGRSYRIIYEVYKSSEIRIIKVEKITKHDYRKK